MPDKDRGLYEKFQVERLARSTRDHSDCRYFVLDPMHDKSAYLALITYATAARTAGFVALADDLDQWLDDISQEHQP